MDGSVAQFYGFTLASRKKNQTDKQTNVELVRVVIEVVTERHYPRASLYTVFRVLLSGANTVSDFAVPSLEQAM